MLIIIKCIMFIIIMQCKVGKSEGNELSDTICFGDREG